MVVGGGKGHAVRSSGRTGPTTSVLPFIVLSVQPPYQGVPADDLQPTPRAVNAPSPDPQTAASSAATHNRFAAVSQSPVQGQDRPAPGGGTPAAGVPPAAIPSQVVTARQPSASVDALLQDSGGDLASSERTPGRERRKGQKRQVEPLELQKGVIRLSIIIILVITVIGYIARTVRRTYPNSDIWNNGVVDLVGVFALGAAIFLMLRAMRVGGLTRESVSPTEASRLSYITMGGILLWLVPIVGSFGYYFGIVFQSSNMHWIFYVLVGGGVLCILYGLSGSKEKGSFYRIFMFGVYGIVMATVPLSFPVFGDALASSFWWSATFVMVSIGFIFMAVMVRQMRADQYAQLDEVMRKADAAFASRRYDEAQKAYGSAITLTHTLYSDQVFSGRNPRERGGASVPDQYFRPWIGKAKCLALQGKLRKSLAIYELMLEVDPDNAAVWFDRGRILVAEKRYAEAYISFDRAVKLNPSLEEAKKARSDTLDVIRKTAI